MADEGKAKSKLVENEERVLEFWDKNKIFKKSLEKEAPKGEFVFYDGPPFATGLPHYGHILAGTIKDVIPRYKTMQGYRVPRRWGWDCHGLPVENLIEKEIGLNTRKDIEAYGIEKFNAAARDAVMRYADEWRKQVPRFGRWVDMQNDYRTMDSHYTESIWWVFNELYEKGLIYEGYKVMQICPRCETTLSNFEVSQGYKDITDISVYVKFELAKEPGTHLLAWTTTPWTLPGNVALAIGKDIEYVSLKATKLPSSQEGTYIVAKERVKDLFKEGEYEIVKEMKGSDLVGLEYKPLFDYYAEDENLLHRKNGWKVYAGDFVTTEDGSGIVHIAPAFGEDDMRLSNEYGLPFVQHVSMAGSFKKEVADFPGLLAKPKEDPQRTDVEIIKWLAHNGRLFEKKKIIHSYPHCWRCETPLLNYATSSWFVKVTEIKNKLLRANSKTSWVPEEIRDGRFGKWLEGARDWAISRSRFWGAPIPVWKASSGEIFVPGHLDELRERTKAKNTYMVMRHGEAESNSLGVLSSALDNPHGLTERGKAQVMASAEELARKKIDLIVHSPIRRAKETASIVADRLGIKGNHFIQDERLREVGFGDLEGREIAALKPYKVEDRFDIPLPGGETYREVSRRVTTVVEDLEKAYAGKTILIVTHDSPAWLLFASAEGFSMSESVALRGTNDVTVGSFIDNAEVRDLHWKPLPRDREGNINLHRPYIDELAVYSSKGELMQRVPDVFDCWFESGSMPYGEARYEGKALPHFDPKGGIFKPRVGFPADFIAEGLDQTRGWFYSLGVLGTALFGVMPFKHVVVNGLVLAEDGRKMSKSLKNYPDPMDIVNRYGADAMRYYMLSSPVVAAEDLRFAEKGVDEIAKKLLQRLDNVLSFYEMYGADAAKVSEDRDLDTDHALDAWIVSRLSETIVLATKSLDEYKLDKASRPLMDLVDDLSNWYLRRSRDRFKSDDLEDKNDALNTTRYVLREFSKLMAPFTPFFAEYVYQKVKGSKGKESVHLDSWPRARAIDSKLVADMKEVRRIVTLGLEARSKAKVNVRQPLKMLRFKVQDSGFKNKADLLGLIKDEVNVKEVVFDEKLETEVALDTAMTPELKEEGDLRELLRAIQDLRKAQGFRVGEEIALTIDPSPTAKALVEKYAGDIKKGAQIRSLSIAPLLGADEVKISDFSAKFKLER